MSYYLDLVSNVRFYRAPLCPLWSLQMVSKVSHMM